MAIQINSTIYGTENDWLDVKSTSTIYDIKLATFQGTYSKEYISHTLGAGIINGSFTGNTIDTSICPIGVGIDSSMNNVAYVGYDEPGTQENYDIHVATPSVSSLLYISSNSPPNYNYSVGYPYLTNSNSGNNSGWIGETTTTYENQTNFPTSLTSVTQPVAEWTYKKAVGLLGVTACKSLNVTLSGNIVFFDLESYINGGFSEYPYVTSVFLLPRHFIYKQDSTVYGNFSNFPNITGTLPTTQTAANLGMIPIGSANTMLNIPSGRGTYNYTYIYQNHILGIHNGYMWNGTNFTNVSNMLGGLATVIGGFASQSTFYANLIGSNASGVYFPVYGYDKFTITHDVTNEKRLFTYWYTADNINEFNEWCINQASYCGMYFTTSYSNMREGNTPEHDFFSDERTYLGLIDSDGITRGNYAKGKDIALYPQSEWDNLRNQSPYDYTKKPDNSIYDDETKLNTTRKQAVGTSFTHIYACSNTDIQQLKQYLYNTVAPESTSESLTQNFLTVNPIDCIVSCYQFPFELGDITGTQTTISLGNTTASVNGTAINAFELLDGLKMIDFGNIFYYPFYNDFRDFEPYTEGLLYVPYIGYMPISPADYINHNIGIKLLCDLCTGSATALIYRDGLVIQTMNGTIGVQIPITGIQQADYANTVHRAGTEYTTAQTQTLSAIVGAVASVATGNMATGINSGLNVVQSLQNRENALYELQHTKVPFKMSGVASSANNFDNEQQARLILKRPIMDSTYNPARYGNTIGFACVITAPLSDFSGYTKAIEAELSGIAATVTEKQMIEQLLQSGIYL